MNLEFKLVNKWVCQSCRRTNDRFEYSCEFCHTSNKLTNNNSSMFIPSNNNDFNNSRIEEIQKKINDS